MPDSLRHSQAHAGRMSFEFLGVLALLVALGGVFLIAALRWGVDSRFMDVRSDF
jgi:hypothetical protein